MPERREKLDRLRVMVVEDEYHVAADLAVALGQAGATVLGPFGWIDEALAALGAGEPAPDLAILDIALHGALSYPVAAALDARGVPFLLASGFDVEAIDPAYRGRPRCQKPVEIGVLIEALRRLV